MVTVFTVANFISFSVLLPRHHHQQQHHHQQHHHQHHLLYYLSLHFTTKFSYRFIMSRAATAGTLVKGRQAHYHPGQQQPNRFTQSFSRMKEVCPNAIKIYASCVLETEENSHFSSSLTKHSCSKEFRSVKECFKKVQG
jgi:hypothetical protein